jgi:hypothetical protein
LTADTDKSIEVSRVPAKQFTCKVISKKWLTPTVVELRFEPSKKFRYEAGQFVSVVVPPPFRAPTLSRDLRRAGFDTGTTSARRATAVSAEASTFRPKLGSAPLKMRPTTVENCLRKLPVL